MSISKFYSHHYCKSGSYSECRYSSIGMRRQQHHLGRKHWRQRNQFKLECIQRKLLQCDIADIDLYTEYRQWHSHLDSDHERSGRSMSGSNLYGGHHCCQLRLCESGNSECRPGSNDLFRNKCDLSRRHRWQRDRFNLERGERHLLERDFSDIDLYTNDYQWFDHPDTDHERS